MHREPEITPCLAPLQRRMLRDSLADPEAGHHVEQIDLVFAANIGAERIVAAWQATVAATQVLRIAFPPNEPLTWQPAPPTEISMPGSRPESWDRWLAADRRNPLLAGNSVPWRAVFWPQHRRFVWTFHHALLDGRSITRVLRSFLAKLAGGETEPLALARWQPPSNASIVAAERLFQQMQLEPPPSLTIPADHVPAPAAVRCLGSDFAARFAAGCESLQITPATALTWCWGQALAAAHETSRVWIEQIRAGAPQPATAGFTMNTLPVEIPLAPAGTTIPSLQSFGNYLRSLREIETVSPTDFPYGVYPDLDGPEISVVMIEHAALHPIPGFAHLVESLALHEPEGHSLAASAHLAPDFRLQVDGPDNHSLLDAWIGRVVSLVVG